MILLFATAHPAYPLYSRDFLRACCWKEGLTVDFGYRAERMPSSLDVENSDALIVFGEYVSQALGQKGDYQYHPVRKVKIKQIATRGSGKTFRLSLGPYFKYGEAATDDFLGRLRGFYRNAADSPSTSIASNERRFVHLHNPWPGQDPFSSDLETQHSVVDHLTRLEGLNSKYFVFVDGDHEFPGATVFCPYDHLAHDWHGGERHSLMLRIFPGAKAKYRPPTVDIGTNICSVSGPFTEQYETGYSARFLFTCKRTFEPDSGMLTVRIPPPDEDKQAIVSPEVQEQIQLKPPKSALLWVMILAGLGSLGTSYGPKLPKPWEAIAPAAAALCVVGALFLGFRRLPLGK